MFVRILPVLSAVILLLCASCVTHCLNGERVEFRDNQAIRTAASSFFALNGRWPFTKWEMQSEMGGWGYIRVEEWDMVRFKEYPDGFLRITYWHNFGSGLPPWKPDCSISSSVLIEPPNISERFGLPADVFF